MAENYKGFLPRVTAETMREVTQALRDGQVDMVWGWIREMHEENPRLAKEVEILISRSSDQIHTRVAAAMVYQLLRIQATVDSIKPL